MDDRTPHTIKEKYIWLFAGIYSLLVYFFLRERTLNGFDPGSFYLAIKYGFSLSDFRPHAPGYPLFVLLWQGIASFGADPHNAIIILNDVFLFLGIGFSYRFIKKYWDEQSAYISTLLIACNPVVLFYSATAEIYIYDLFFSVCTIYLFLSVKKKYISVAFFWLALSMGFRLSSVILLSPVFVFILWSRRKEILSARTIVVSVLLFISGFLLWAYPYYISLGGFSEIIQALKDAAELSSTVYQNAAAYISYFLWALNIGWLFFIILRKQPQQKNLRMLLLLWFCIPTMFFLAEHYAKGYILLVLAPLVILLGRKLSRKKKLAVISVLGNLCLFFLIPFITPRVESTLPKSQRSATERFETALARMVSFFGPTYSHIRTIDTIVSEAGTLLESSCPPHSMIIVDNSAGEWTYPRSLQAIHPDLDFISINALDSTIVTRFSESSMDSRYPVKDVLAKDTLFYMTDPRLVHLLGEPPGALLLSRTSWLSLYEIHGQEKNIFWKYFTKTK